MKTFSYREFLILFEVRKKKDSSRRHSFLMFLDWFFVIANIFCIMSMYGRLVKLEIKKTSHSRLSYCKNLEFSMRQTNNNFQAETDNCNLFRMRSTSSRCWVLRDVNNDEWNQRLKLIFMHSKFSEILPSPLRLRCSELRVQMICYS